MQKRVPFVLILVFCMISPAMAGGVSNLSPSAACGLLDEIGLPTRGWRTYVDDDCGCASFPGSIGPGNPYRNQISYYADGTGQTVTWLRLIVTVLNAEAGDSAVAAFQAAAGILIEKVTRRPVAESVFKAIAGAATRMNRRVIRTGDVIIELTRKEWTMTTDLGSRKCYEIKLMIH